MPRGALSQTNPPLLLLLTRGREGCPGQRDGGVTTLGSPRSAASGSPRGSRVPCADVSPSPHLGHCPPSALGGTDRVKPHGGRGLPTPPGGGHPSPSTPPPPRGSQGTPSPPWGGACASPPPPRAPRHPRAHLGRSGRVPPVPVTGGGAESRRGGGGGEIRAPAAPKSLYWPINKPRGVTAGLGTPWGPQGVTATTKVGLGTPRGQGQHRAGDTAGVKATVGLGLPPLPGSLWGHGHCRGRASSGVGDTHRVRATTRSRDVMTQGTLWCQGHHWGPCHYCW